MRASIYVEETSGEEIKDADRSHQRDVVNQSDVHHVVTSVRRYSMCVTVVSPPSESNPVPLAISKIARVEVRHPILKIPYVFERLSISLHLGLEQG